jgi:hypothetical protein
MPYSRAELGEISKSVGRNWRTLQRWARAGCDLRSSESLNAFLTAKELRRTNVARAREKRGGNESKAATKTQTRPEKRSDPIGNGDALGPVGERGAGAALRRLEEQEERAPARLQLALEAGDHL